MLMVEAAVVPEFSQLLFIVTAFISLVCLSYNPF